MSEYLRERWEGSAKNDAPRDARVARAEECLLAASESFLRNRREHCRVAAGLITYMLPGPRRFRRLPTRLSVGCCLPKSLGCVSVVAPPLGNA